MSCAVFLGRCTGGVLVLCVLLLLDWAAVSLLLDWMVVLCPLVVRGELQSGRSAEVKLVEVKTEPFTGGLVFTGGCEVSLWI